MWWRLTTHMMSWRWQLMTRLRPISWRCRWNDEAIECAETGQQLGVGGAEDNRLTADKGLSLYYWMESSSWKPIDGLRQWQHELTGNHAWRVSERMLWRINFKPQRAEEKASCSSACFIFASFKRNVLITAKTTAKEIQKKMIIIITK